MGARNSKLPRPNPYASRDGQSPTDNPAPPLPPKSLPPLPSATPFLPSYTPSPAHHKTKTSANPAATPLRFFRKSFPPPSPAKHIRAVLRLRKPSKKQQTEETIPEEGEEEAVELDKRFGFSKELRSRLEVGEEVGRGHFGYTCSARFKKGPFKGQQVAVKVIPKSKMATAIAVEDVRREVKILQALTGHDNIVKFYDAFEDRDNVYIVME